MPRGVRVQLFGGRVRERIELSMSIHMDAPEAMVAQAEAFLAQGFRTVKVAVGVDADPTCWRCGPSAMPPGMAPRSASTRTWAG